MRLSFLPLVLGLGSCVVLAACSGASTDGGGGPGTPAGTDPGTNPDGTPKDGTTPVTDNGVPTAPKLTVAAPSDVLLGRGGPVEIPVTVTRTGTLGAVTLRITNLPAGFTSSPVTVAASETSAVITLRASEDASDLPMTATLEGAAGALLATTTLSVKAPKQQSDTSFGKAGAIRIPGITLTDALPLPDGKTLALGTSVITWSKVVLRRFQVNGAVDASFGTNGIFQLPDLSASVSNMRAGSLAPKGDGSVYVSLQGTYSAQPTEIVIAHVLANGTLDASFGVAGYARMSFDGWSGVDARGLVVQGDGKILVAGAASNSSSSASDTPVRAVLARLTPAGQLDGSFGTGGKRVSTFGNTNALANGLRIVSGKAYVFGRGDYVTGVFKGFLARIDDAGALDATFAAGGVATTEHSLADAVPTPAGKWLVTGAQYAQQLASDGAKDTSFGSQGYILDTSPLGSAGYAMDQYAIGVSGSGRISAFIGSTSHDRLELWSFDATGQRITTFAGTGSILLDTPGENPLPIALRPTADGRFIAVGRSIYYPAESVLARFFP